jgi:hypothetical protein
VKLGERDMDCEMKGLEEGNFNKMMKANANELGIKIEMAQLKEILSMVIKISRDSLRK